MIVIVFDEDKAGDIGRYKITKEYGSTGIDFLSLGESDSNDLMKVMGIERFTQHVKSRVPSFLR
jgi:hypothetical protein